MSISRVAVLFLVVATSSLVHAQAPTPAACQEWRECGQLAIDAQQKGDYERFHDLAWRAFQIGPEKNASLMYLLARAQALSGRPHDALIMLQRLAEIGEATDAGTNDEFASTRQLPGWPEVEAALVKLGMVPSPLSERPAPAPAPTAAAPAPAPVPTPAVTSSAAAGTFATPQANPVARFSARRFTAGGLAFDAVSQRFVVGDARERKLVVVSVGADHSVDLVRGGSAGFQEVAALDIDDRRGDLWVASTPGTDGDSTLHRLQLVSGRPLRTYRASPSAGHVQIVDLAVAASGAVILLDAASSRLLTLARGAADMIAIMNLALPSPTSLVATPDENLFYVAYADGIALVNTRAHTTSPLAASSDAQGVALSGFNRIRLSGRSLLGLTTTATGSTELVRFALSADGRGIRDVATLDLQVSTQGQRPFMTVAGSDVYYLSEAPTASSQASGEIMVRRIQVR